MGEEGQGEEGREGEEGEAGEEEQVGEVGCGWRGGFEGFGIAGDEENLKD